MLFVAPSTMHHVILGVDDTLRTFRILETSPISEVRRMSPTQHISDHPVKIKVPTCKQADYSYREHRFNLVLYGVQESPEGTNRYDQIESDTENVVKILHKINPSITNISIRGCFRIGKFSPTKTRPLIVVFQRVQDVCLILQRLSPDILPNGIAIKPHMSATEMKVQSILLRERWKLYTQSGVDKR